MREGNSSFLSQTEESVREKAKRLQLSNTSRSKAISVAKTDMRNKLVKLEMDYPPLLEKLKKEGSMAFKRLAQHR